MRTLMTARLNTEKANEAIKDGTLQETMRAVMEQLKPEAAYFGAGEGLRTAYLVFDLEHPSQIPVSCEPFFIRLGAEIDLTPVMNLDDVQSGLGELAKKL